MLDHRDESRPVSTRWRGVLPTSTAIALLLSSPLARAADPAVPSAEAGGLEEVVVTGAATALGLKKLDTAFSVTSFSEKAIKEANITAPADILKQSPGVFVESSGGRGGGANVEVTGLRPARRQADADRFGPRPDRLYRQRRLRAAEPR